ncbi:signal peptidase I [Psittacicella hinzii]|nr:signal peptidase I [Psittacicella hinzii]
MKKHASLLAFIIVVALFVLLYRIFMDNFSNGLSIIWVIMLLVFLAAYTVRRFYYVPYFRKQKAQELNLQGTEQDLKQNKELNAAAKVLARKTLAGELSSYFIFFLVIFVFRAFVYEPFKIPSGSMQPTLEIGDYIAVNKHQYRLHDPIWQKTIVRLNPVERGDIVVFKEPRQQKEDWIKRVIGLPGDIVHYDQYNQKFLVISNCQNPRSVAQGLDWTSLTNNSVVGEGCKVNVFTYGQFSANYDYFYLNSYQNQRTETLMTSDGHELSHYTLQNPQPLDYAQANVYRQEGMPVLTWVVPEDKYFMVGDNRDNSEDSRFVGFIPFENIVGKAEFIWFSLKYDNTGNTLTGVNYKRIFTGLYPNILSN